MQRFARPTVVVSKCLGLGVCRYDGARLIDGFVRQLRRRVRMLPVCPEIEIGLGIPREPIIIVGTGQRRQLWQPATGRKHTREMTTFSKRYLASASVVDGFILKSRSPSCGIRDVRLSVKADPESRSIGQGAGFFAAEVLKAFPNLPVEDERRLSEAGIREHWLTRLFTIASFRAVEKAGVTRRLAQYHSENRLLLSVCNGKATAEMDRIVMKISPNDSKGIWKEYRLLLLHALTRSPKRASVTKALQAALDHYAPNMDHNQRTVFKQSLSDFAQGKVPLRTIRNTVRVWGVRYDKSYVKAHTFFRPYPDELAEA